jgi:predicted ArsR family transcriptional regulator
MYEAIFGSPTAERVLLYIQNYGEGHANGIAKTFKIAPSQVHKQLLRLESNGILVGKTVGRTHTFVINPRLAIKNELSGLLEKTLSLLPDEQKAKYFRQRTRPRRTGKKR